jgi:hypothetical protein
MLEVHNANLLTLRKVVNKRKSKSKPKPVDSNKIAKFPGNTTEKKTLQGINYLLCLGKLQADDVEDFVAVWVVVVFCPVSHEHFVVFLSCYINDIYLSHRACARNKRISHYMYQLTTCTLLKIEISLFETIKLIIIIIDYNKLTHTIY